MKAMVLTKFGGPEGFEMQERERPTPGPNDVLVKVHATSVNPADAGVRSGMFGPMMQTPVVLGYDVAGTVEEVGAGVEGFAPGDEVYYAVDLMDRRGGADAEYHLTHVGRVAKKPKNLSFAEAAAVPVAGGTAYAALVSAADVRLGQSVLIHGGAGGVGHYAVQLAKAAGAYVFATCGGYDADFVKSLGADRVIDYRNENFVEVVNGETGGEGVDVALDAAGGKLSAESINAVKMGGQIATITGAQGDLNPAMRKNITVHFVHLEDAQEKLEQLRTLFERGQIKSVVGATYPLEKLGEAHSRVEQGGEGLRGKVVVEVA